MFQGEKMRIAILSGAYGSLMNGVTTTVTETVKLLEAWGHEVLVIWPEWFEEARGTPNIEWKQSFALPGYDIIRMVKPTPKNYRKMARALDEFGPDSLHFATECTLGWMGVKYAKSRKCMFSSAYHTMSPEIGGQIARVKWKLPYRPSKSAVGMYIKMFHDLSSSVMVTLPTLRDRLAVKGFKNLHLWSRGVDHEIFHPDGPKYEFDTKGKPVYMHFARLSLDKGFPRFCELKNNGLDGYFVAFGEGPSGDVERWKKKYPWVNFMGRASGSDRGKALRSADALIFLSQEADTFGLITPEANSCGTPVAATDTFPHIDLIKNGVNGWTGKDIPDAARRCLDVTAEGCVTEGKKYTWERATREFVENLVRVK